MPSRIFSFSVDLISGAKCTETLTIATPWFTYPGAEAADDETAMAILSVWGWKAMQRTRACVVVVINCGSIKLIHPISVCY